MRFGKQKVEQVILKFCHVYFISSPKIINCLDPLTFCLLYPGLVPSHRMHLLAMIHLHTSRRKKLTLIRTLIRVKRVNWKINEWGA